MKITVNGEKMDVGDNLSVQAILDALKLSEERVAVELNRAIVERESFRSSILREGDRVEIIGFVGGGNENR